MKFRKGDKVKLSDEWLNAEWHVLGYRERWENIVMTVLGYSRNYPTSVRVLRPAITSRAQNREYRDEFWEGYLERVDSQGAEE